MTELARMRRDIYENGTNIAIVHSVPSETVEAWVRAVRAWSQVDSVDWHWLGGRARVAALGDEAELTRVAKACKALLPALDAILPGLYPMIYEPDSEREASAGAVVYD